MGTNNRAPVVRKRNRGGAGVNAASLDQVVNAVLYEGYILYPYRASSQKNSRARFTFGRVYPQAYSAAQKGIEPCLMQAECLARGRSATMKVTVRFLQPMWREVGLLESDSGAFCARAEPRYRIIPE